MNRELIDKIRDKKHYHVNIESLKKHLTNYFRDEQITIFHEFASFDFHLDVYYIKLKESPCDILITSGMSLLAMTIPDQVEIKTDYQFAELMMPVPKTIKISNMPSDGNGDDWVISMMKDTARFPHHYDTWLTEGHTLQATHNMETYCDQTNFVGCILLQSASFDEKLTEFITKDGEKINIYSIFPLYKNELEYKIDNGYNAFFDLLINAHANDVFDNNRSNLIK